MTLSRKRTILLAATLIAGATAAGAMAQGVSTFDPAQMPEIHGKVAQYDLNPRGDVDGLILQDGTEVHFPPHLGTEIVAAVRPGEAVTIHGLKARTLPLVQAMSVTGDASGKTVVDNGPPGPGRRPPPPRPHPHGGTELQAQGKVKMALHGPRGEVNGALLEDGTMIHLPPPEATRLAASLQPGSVIAVRGPGVENSLGRSIEVHAFGPSADKLVEMAPPPPHGHGPHGHGGPDDHGGPMPDGDAPPPR